MATPRKKTAFSSKTSDLKRNNVITKYFPSKSSGDSLSGKLSDCSNSLKNLCSKEKNLKPKYHVVNETVVLLDSDDEDEHEKNLNMMDLLKSPRHNDVSTTLSNVISSVARSVDKERFQKASRPNAESLHSEQRTVLSAFNSNLNSTDKKSNDPKDSVVKRNFSSPCRSSPSQSSHLSRMNSPGQASPHSCAKKHTPLVGVKRKQSTLDSCLKPKIQKCDIGNKIRSFSQPTCSSSDRYTANARNATPPQRSCSTVAYKDSDNVIVDLTEGIADQKDRTARSELVDKGDNLVDLTTEKCSSLRKTSSDSEVRSAEYETGYDSMTENSKPPRLDDLGNLYCLFENLASDSQTVDRCMFTSDDVFPVYSNITNENSSENTSLQDKVAFPGGKFESGSCCGSVSSTDKGISFSSDDENDFLDAANTDTFSHRQSIEFASEEINKEGYNSDKDAFETEGSEKEITFTLSRILKDKKENENFKLIEEELLQYVKSGGFSRFLNESSDEEYVHETDETYRNLERMINSTEDCQGLEDHYEPTKIFSRKRLYCCYCPHTIARGEAILPHFLYGLDLQTQLNFVHKNASIIVQRISLNQAEERASNTTCTAVETFTCLLEWLLQVLTTNTDITKLRLAETAILSLLSNSNLEVQIPHGFHKVFANLGMREKFLCNGFRQEKPSICKKCKANSARSFSVFQTIPFVLRVLIQFLSRRPHALSDANLRHLMVFITLLLSEIRRDAQLQSLVNCSLMKVVQAVREWKDVRLLVLQDLLNHVEDVHVLYHIVSVLSTATQRTIDLRRSIALVALGKHVEGVEIQPRHLDEIDANSIEMTEELSSKLTIDNVRLSLEEKNDNVTNLMVFNTLWFCVLLLQTCIGDVNVKCKENLEAITQSFRSLNLAIKENGCLYCSEIKHHIRLTTAVAEIHLHDMPKSQLYQQGIFKYLRAAKVDEEVVGVKDDDDSETDEDAKESDSPSLPCTITHGHETPSPMHEQPLPTSTDVAIEAENVLKPDGLSSRNADSFHNYFNVENPNSNNVDSILSRL